MKANLILFFTRGVSLKSWLEGGIFEREKLPYERYLEKGRFEKIYWITYGKKDRKLAEELKQANKLHERIYVLDKPAVFCSKIGDFLFSLLIPFFFGKIIKNANLIKTNQLDGSWSAVFAKWLYKKPLIVRAGYIRSKLLESRKTRNLKKIFYKYTEAFAFRFCDRIIVTSAHDLNYVLNTYRVKKEKAEVIPNFVDTEAFRAFPNGKRSENAVFVGRLDYEKNLFNLIEAFSHADINLDIYGTGPIEKDLMEYAKEKKSNVHFRGVIANNQLPGVLSSCGYFLLPSFHEGMPKALIEAMACGVVCLATANSGMREIIEDGRDGYLINGTAPQDIQEALNKAALSRNEAIGIKAADKVRKKYSLDVVLDKEYAILKRFLYE